MTAQEMYFELSSRRVVRHGAHAIDIFWGMIPQPGTPFSREGIIFRLWRDGQRAPLQVTHDFERLIAFVREIAPLEQWRVVAASAGHDAPLPPVAEYIAEVVL